MARSIAEQRRRSRYLPSQPWPRARVAVAPEATAPRFSFVVHVPSTFASHMAGRSQKRVKAFDLPTRHLMPAPDPAIAEHACFTPQAAVFVLVGSQLVLARALDTALAFGQGRPHASGWRCEFKD